MFEADRETDRLWRDTDERERLGRQLAVRRGSGMCHERLDVTHVHEALEELDRVEEANTGVVAAGDAEGDNRRAVTLEIARGELEVRELRVAEVAQPGDPRV